MENNKIDRFTTSFFKLIQNKPTTLNMTEFVSVVNDTDNKEIICAQLVNPHTHPDIIVAYNVRPVVNICCYCDRSGSRVLPENMDIEQGRAAEPTDQEYNRSNCNRDPALLCMKKIICSYVCYIILIALVIILYHNTK